MNRDTGTCLKETTWSRFRNITPIGVSLIAMVISLFSLFLSQLQPDRIKVYPGELAYLRNLEDNILSFNLFLSFTNGGARPGVVRKIAVLLIPPDKSDGYILQAAFFDQLDSEGNFFRESVVGPIAVDGHQTVSRQVRFISARENPGDYIPLLVQGEYQAIILLWTSTDSQPTITVQYPFMLSDRDLEELQLQREGKLNQSVELSLRQFDQWKAGTINEQEDRDLLGTLEWP